VSAMKCFLRLYCRVHPHYMPLPCACKTKSSSGTDYATVERILDKGFQRDFSSVTALGRGVYFARDASYSAGPRYAKPGPAGHQTVILAKVAVGAACEGNCLMKEPEPGCDSMVDHLGRRPAIVVSGHHDALAVPAYVVEFVRTAAAPAFGFPAPAPAAAAFGFPAPVPAVPAFDFGAPALAAPAVRFPAPEPTANSFGFGASTAPTFGFGATEPTANPFVFGAPAAPAFGFEAPVPTANSFGFGAPVAPAFDFEDL